MYSEWYVLESSGLTFGLSARRQGRQKWLSRRRGSRVRSGTSSVDSNRRRGACPQGCPRAGVKKPFPKARRGSARYLANREERSSRTPRSYDPKTTGSNPVPSTFRKARIHRVLWGAFDLTSPCPSSLDSSAASLTTAVAHRISSVSVHRSMGPHTEMDAMARPP